MCARESLARLTRLSRLLFIPACPFSSPHTLTSLHLPRERGYSEIKGLREIERDMVIEGEMKIERKTDVDR